jgi:uncharacterized protein (DUF4415 family)
VLYSATIVTPSTKKQTNFRIDPDILEGLQEVKERDGIPLSEQMRRALRAWLDSKGITTKAATRRAGTRRKA